MVDQDNADRRDAAPQWVLPLVIRAERATPPAHTDALTAAARAVLLMLADPRSVDGEWAEPVAAWQDGRIRKVVRRARGAAWQRAVELPGLTVRVASAEVRVHPPVPLDGWPVELARLQVSGIELADPQAPPVPDSAWPVLWLNPGLSMTSGKSMAQAGHGAQLVWWASAESHRASWSAAGFPLAVRTAPAARWSGLVARELPMVHDGGFTEVRPGSLTVIGEAPWLGGR